MAYPVHHYQSKEAQLGYGMLSIVLSAKPEYRKKANTIKEFYRILHETYFPISQQLAREAASDKRVRCLSIIAGCKPKDVLEIGFEDPRLSKLIADRWNYVGIDISEISVKAALAQGLQAIAIDVSQEEIPFDDCSFDLVYCSEVVEHLLNPDFAFREFKRVLKPGGKILITTPNLGSWYNRIILLLGIQPIHTEVSTLRIVGRKFHSLGQGSRPVGHIRPFTLRGLLDFFDLHSLRVIHFEGYSLDLMRRFQFLDRLGSRFPSLASGFIVLAEKPAM